MFPKELNCMAIRNIRKDGDEILRKRSREVDQITPKIRMLLKDMVDTLYKADGAGLAAPQVGVLKRIILVDVGTGLYQLINPVLKSQSGEQCVNEGCLSVPGIWGEVKRPAQVVVEALDPDGEKIVVEGEGLLAQALCHEIDHLDGILFKDKVIRFLDQDEINGAR
jgi:peptide deformylase